MDKASAIRILPAVVLLGVAAVTPAAAETALVTSSANDGEGSLRAALDAGASEILIGPSVGTISITESLVYDSDDPLQIIGTGQTVDASGLREPTAPILHITDGADLQISDLTLDAGGGNSAGRWSRFNPGGGKGIYVEIPDDRRGTVTLAAHRVVVTGAGNHGIHVSDCSLRSDCGSGVGGGGDGSRASLRVHLFEVRVEHSGHGYQDADGVRIDERGRGDIDFFAAQSAFEHNGGDGLELDEGNSGSLRFRIADTTFRDNGDYCHAADLEVFTECDDDGAADLEDGFDADEAGRGGLYGSLTNVDVANNRDEDLDFDEEDKDGALLSFVDVTALRDAGTAEPGVAAVHGSLNGTPLAELLIRPDAPVGNAQRLTGHLTTIEPFQDHAD